MTILPPALENLIEAFGSLPGVGSRTAERYAYFLVRHGSDTPQKLASALLGLQGGLGYCEKRLHLYHRDKSYPIFILIHQEIKS